MSTTILIYILSGIIIVLVAWLIIIELRFKKLFLGKNAQSLENLILNMSSQVEDTRKTQLAINGHLVNVDKRLNKSIRKIETLRFNPFLEAGGNQSFAISLLNDEGDGVVISSLYARDRMSIFAKPITSGKSEFELSNEEKEVLKKSIG